MRSTAALYRDRELSQPESPERRHLAVVKASVEPDWRYPADMPVAVHAIALACWVAFLGVFWITFAISGNAEFMVAISTIYAVMFFSVPVILIRMFPRKTRAAQSLRVFLRGRFRTFHGSISGFDALVQVIVVPASLTLGGIAMGFIIHAARAAH